MEHFSFLDSDGTFSLKNPDNNSYIYFPIAGEAGLKSAITPRLAGDAKLNQNTFLLEPVSAENLHNNRNNRNFWCNVKGKGCWSAVGASAEQYAKLYTQEQEESMLCAGLMWHKMTRTSEKYGLCAEITSFVPIDCNIEVMQVKLTNISKEQIEFTPTAVIPIYGRSADNIRDHRHVTSLLHRIKTTKYGVEVKPALSFDERGHQINHITYFVCGADEMQTPPRDFYPVVDMFIDEGGNFDRPYAIIKDLEGVKADTELEGLEAVGGLHFNTVQLAAGTSTAYTVLFGISDREVDSKGLLARFCGFDNARRELEKVKSYWKERVNVVYETGDRDFNQFMKWVSFQPVLRRIYGCSFLPHHDYGKGGRGWRDLWQDCLALLIMNPDGVRQMLIDNFAGVRIDGSNATIIGSRQGEFIADRNNITRVWMDHGVWPFMTTKFYIDQTGDIGLLKTEVPYFKDKQICRGTKTDDCWNESYGCWQKAKSGSRYEGTILEHLLLQNLTAFYEVGEHNIIRLRGADWNDALDMASERGESVAFSNAYAGNLRDLAELLTAYQKKTGETTVSLLAEMIILLEDGEELYRSVEKKQNVLKEYLNTCVHDICGERIEVSIEKLAENLQHKSAWLMQHIRVQEWVQDREGNGWFNGYYDNHGKRVEGEFAGGVRMMLTGQVFSIMAGTALPQQISAITKSADKYLYQEEIGGYRLNTNFHELKTDLGRMFGFSYGDKENGAVFSHMAVMYANALYKRGFVKEGFRSLNALEKQAMNFRVSHIYPGIPEYFNARGRGMYHYLTGAASWYMLTVITEMFGIRGALGDMVLEPKLLKEQFNEEQEAAISLIFQGKHWKVSYHNENDKEYGEYEIGKVFLDRKETAYSKKDGQAVLSKEMLDEMDTNTEHILRITLV